MPGAGEVTNEALFRRALDCLPGGVSSPVRAFRSVGGTPYFVARGEGAYVVDVEGRRYLDYVQSYGASILGHADPAVLDAIAAAAAGGTSFGAPTLGEVLLAEEVRRRVPAVELLRFTSSGTEATMSAIRVARGFTGRSRVVKFAGCYHGHADLLLAGGGSGLSTLGLPDSAGVPTEAVAETVVAPYNAVPDLDERVACVIVEPVAANMGVVPPEPGFLGALRTACDETGALLVFDEVITGFRLGPGGAAERFGVRPDLLCFGKVLGGGLPIGAFGGRRDVMEVLAPIGPVYQAGTLSGNPLATAAGLAALRQLDRGAYDRLEDGAAELAAGLALAAEDAGVALQVPRVGPLLGVFFAAQPVTDYEGAKASAATGRYPVLFHALLREGVAFAPGAYEALFPSLAHGDAERAATLVAAGKALRAVAASG